MFTKIICRLQIPSKNTTFLFTSFIFFVAGIFLPIFLLLYALCIFPFLIGTSYSYSFRLLLSWMIVFMLNVTLYFVFSALSLQIEFIYITLVYAVSIFLVTIYKIYKHQFLIFDTTNFIKKEDVVSLLFGVATLLMMLLPVFKNNTSEFWLFLTSGEDNASHIAIVNYSLSNEEYAYFEEDNTSGLIKSLDSYPQGMHLNQAIVSDLILIDSSQETRLLYSYYIQGAIYFGFLAFLIVYLSQLLYRKFSERYLAYPILSASPFIFCLIACGPMLYSAGWGFYTQILSYVFLLILLTLQMMKPKFFDAKTLILSITAVAAISNVWYFLVPIAIACMLPEIKHIKLAVKNIPVTISAAVLGCVTLLPIYISQQVSKNTDPLNLPGGIYIMSTLTIIFVCVFLIISMAFTKFALLENKKNTLVIPALASLMLTVYVWQHQISTIGHNEYYFYKSVYTLYLFAFILFIFLLSILLEKVFSSTKFSKRINLLIFFVILAGFSLIANMTTSSYWKVYINNWFNHQVQIADIEYLRDSLDDDNNYDDTIFFGDCDSAGDYMSNRFAGALHLSETNERSEFVTSTLPGSREEDTKAGIDYANNFGGNINISITSSCAVQTEIQNLELDKNDNYVIR